MAKKDSDRSLTKLQQKNGTVTDSDLKIPNSKNNKLNHKRKKNNLNGKEIIFNTLWKLSKKFLII